MRDKETIGRSSMKRKISDEVEHHDHRKRDGYGLHVSSFHNEESQVLRNRAEDARRRITEAEKPNAVEKEKKEKHRIRHHQMGNLMAKEKEVRLAQTSQDVNDGH